MFNRSKHILERHKDTYKLDLEQIIDKYTSGKYQLLRQATKWLNATCNTPLLGHKVRQLRPGTFQRCHVGLTVHT